MEALNETQREAQAAFAASVPGAEQIMLPGTTRYVQTQRPDGIRCEETRGRVLSQRI